MENKKELQRLGAYTQALVEIKDWCAKVQSDNKRFVEEYDTETYFDNKRSFFTHRIENNINDILKDLTAIGELYD